MSDAIKIAEEPTRRGSAGLPPHRCERVIDYVHAHLDKPLYVDELAALVCQSPFHFSRMFKLATGLSPNRFVTLARIDKARELLAETSLPIRQVALASGYRTHAHFSGVFTRHVGMTPNRFRVHVGLRARSMRTQCNATAGIECPS